jgi:hypothetical protein
MIVSSINLTVAQNNFELNNVFDGSVILVLPYNGLDNDVSSKIMFNLNSFTNNVGTNKAAAINIYDFTKINKYLFNNALKIFEIILVF